MASPIRHGARQELLSVEEPLSAPAAMSPSVRRSPRKTNLKLRRSPTVTPKRFGRFFTPRTLLQKGTRFRVSRLALGDITASAGNTKHGKRQVWIKGDPALADDPHERGLLGCKDVPNLRKRKTLHSPDVTPEKPIASKRTRHRSVSISIELENTGCHAITSVYEDSYEDRSNSGESIQELPSVIIRSRFRGALGSVARRELHLPHHASRLAKTVYGTGMI